MTTAQTMLARAAFGLALALPMPFAGCVAPPTPYQRPAVLVSPYAGREVVLAVAPLRNESGVSLVDELAISDTLVNEAQPIDGVSVLPVNRTLAGLRALQLPSVTTEAEALALCKALGADGVLVGTITAWHPYDPPVIGMSLGLFGVSATLHAAPPALADAARLRAASTDRPIDDPAGARQPLSSLSRTFDASDGNTRDAIRLYATGRHDPESALGWKRYTASMALYAKFACHEMTRLLLDLEHERLRGSAARAEAAPIR